MNRPRRILVGASGEDPCPHLAFSGKTRVDLISPDSRLFLSARVSTQASASINYCTVLRTKTADIKWHALSQHTLFKAHKRSVVPFTGLLGRCCGIASVLRGWHHRPIKVRTCLSSNSLSRIPYHENQCLIAQCFSPMSHQTTNIFLHLSCEHRLQSLRCLTREAQCHR